MKTIILYIILSASFIYGQDPLGIWIPTTDNQTLSGRIKPFYSYSPINVGATSSDNLLMFNGARLNSIVSSGDTGTVRAPIPYLSWWFNFTSIISNGDFDSNINGWTRVPGYYVGGTTYYLDTLKWVASGGGYTGALYCKGSPMNPAVIGYNPNNDYIKFPPYAIQKGRYIMSFDINITELLPGTWIMLVTQDNPLIGLDPDLIIRTAGEHHVEIPIISQTAHTNNIARLKIYFSNSLGKAAFYLDNVAYTPAPDSVQAYSKILNYPIEDTVYYWRQSIEYTEGDGDYVFKQASADTVITKLIAPHIIEAAGQTDGGIITWADNSNRELGYSVQRDTSIGSSWTPIDTVSANTTSYLDETAIQGGHYKWRINAMGRYQNSSYSTEAFAVIPAVTNDPIDGLYDSAGNLVISADFKIIVMQQP